jgi:hypothetical protein
VWSSWASIRSWHFSAVRGRAKLIEYLRADPQSLDPDGRLDHAAKMGMSGGGGAQRGVNVL